MQKFMMNIGIMKFLVKKQNILFLFYIIIS